MKVTTMTNKMVYDFETAEGDKLKIEVPFPKDDLDEETVLAQGQAMMDSGAFKPGGHNLSVLDSCYSEVSVKDTLDPADFDL